MPYWSIDSQTPSLDEVEWLSFLTWVGINHILLAPVFDDGDLVSQPRFQASSLWHTSIPCPGQALLLLFLVVSRRKNWLTNLRVNSPTNGLYRLFSFSSLTRLEGFPSHPTLHYRRFFLSNTGNQLHSMPASLSAARRSTALPSSNSAFSFSRLSYSPPGVRNRQERRGTYLTARKWNQSRLLQDSFDLVNPFYYKVKSQFKTETPGLTAYCPIS